MADQDPFGGLRTGPWVGVNNDPLFQGLTDENTVTPGGVIEDQSITNAKIVNLNADKIDAGTLKVTGSMSIETSGLIPQLEIGPTGTIMRDSGGNTVLEIRGTTTTFNGDIISAGSISGSQIEAGTITATNLAADSVTSDKIVAGTITATDIATGTITATQIAAGTITTNEIAANTITAGDIAANTITAANMVTGTITAASGIIADAAITNAKIASIDAGKITAGQLSLTPMSATAITSTNFTVSNTGAVTAKQLTLNPSTSEQQGIDAAAGAITITPPTGFGSAVLKTTNSAGTDDFDVVGFDSSPGAAALATATVNTDTTHNFKVGQMVSFHSVGGEWNNITATAPVQILSVPSATSFTISHFVILPAVATNSAGTIRAYKRLAVRAAGGLYVYRDGSNAGDIAAGSLVLGNNLANYGKANLATVADGELAFIKQATPRYGSGANLYSSNGTTNVSTSGNFTAAGGVNTTLVASTSDLSAQIDGGDLIIRHGTGAGVNPRILFRNGAGTYISGLRATVGTLTHYADSGTTTLGNFTSGSITGSTITSTGNLVSNGNGLLNDTPVTNTTPTTYTSGRAAIWTNTAGTAYQLQRYVAASSARAKKNIESTSVAPEQFYGINLVDFEYDSEAGKKIWPSLSDMPEGTQHGVIYEQVKEVMPEAVFDENTSGAGDPPGINWDQIYFAALVALQDMNERVRTLENRIDELESQSEDI